VNVSNYDSDTKLITTLQDLSDLIAIKDANFSNVDVVFCCLPHGTTQVLSYVIWVLYFPKFSKRALVKVYQISMLKS